MKLNFESMTRAEIKAYLFKHRDDMDAFRALINRPPKGKVYKFLATDNVAEKIEELLRSEIERET